MEELLGQFSFGLFILQTVLFVGLILLLKKFAWNSTNPTKGFLLLPEEVMDMMINPEYDSEE